MNNQYSSQYIQAAVVNHNTSKYTELMLRSLFVRHPSDLDLSITVFDNNSQDNMEELLAYTREKGIPIIPSGYALKTKWNSHGEILRKFVLDHQDCNYYLFLDTDVCFLQADTLAVMVQELEQAPTAFGIAPRISSNGETEIEEKYWEIVYQSRLHPCCALVCNTPVFRRVTEEIGLSCVQYLWAAGEVYLDTFKLMTMVMSTHSLSHILSAKMILHFFSVSYDWESPHVMAYKANLRDRLLEEFRNL